MNNKVAILDAGAQYGKVIDRRVRELQVESEILPLTTPTAELAQYQALIISGGPESVYGASAPEYNPDIFTLNKPILGVCYGLQLMNYVHGGTVVKKGRREDGPCQVKIETDSQLFSGLDSTQEVLMTHGDTIDQVADDYRVIADSDGLVAGIENQSRQHYGVQFHPEVDLTENGMKMLQNFLYQIAGFDGSYTVADRRAQAIAEIQETVKDQDVLLLVSGGVDSTVCAALLGEALPPEQIHLLHIDNGFMRQGESQQVETALAKAGLKIKVVDASESFAQAQTTIDGQPTEKLSKTISPEVKRKIIGDTFVKVAKQAIADLQLDPEYTFLAQGTLRPDLIESASKVASNKAQTIKTHHNDSPLVRELRDQGRVIEPLKDYHKDEVRELGSQLGLPDAIVWRQPFPGPGLAIRTICAKTPFTDQYQESYQALQQFATDKIKVTLLPIKTVGVQGDGRTYSYAAALSGQADWTELRHLALEIPKTSHLVNRVVYIFGKSVSEPITEVTPTTLTVDVLDQLRAADAIVNELLIKHHLTQKISQVPVVSVPLPFGKPDHRSIVIRTFITNDFMTGVPALPGKEMPEDVLDQLVSRILKEVPGVSRVLYDLTSKPPGTTEWE